MSKKEIVWREILYQAIEQKNRQMIQKELAAKFGFSLSTVFNALKIPRQIGAIKVTGRNFRVTDLEKFLYLWATARNFKKDIIYRTKVDEPILTARKLIKILEKLVFRLDHKAGSHFIFYDSKST